MGELISEYFSTDDAVEKKRLRSKYFELVATEGSLFEDSERAQQLKSYRPFDSENSALFFDPMQMFGVANFDVVIGNPPYVGIQGIDPATKKRLERKYGFSDDLYSHFFFRGFEFLAPNGSLAFITSKSFWTIQSKKNLRKLLLEKHIQYIYDTSNPFESAMVDTCIVMCQQTSRGSVSQFLSLAEKYAKPTSITFDQALFIDTVNLVIFPPTEYNMKIHEKFNNSVNGLVERWWESIRTNTAKALNAEKLSLYTSELKPGDVALLGTLADGGDGLTTGNNGRYIGVLATSNQGQRVKHQRAKKLAEFLLSEGINSLGKSEPEINSELEKMSEAEVFKFVEELKDQHGRDILGKGFVYRIVDPNSVADVSEMSDTSREVGIDGSRFFVPYDKGDRDGNSWFLPTPFFIDWGRESVKHLKESPASYVRNSKFYFKPGVCWIFTLNETSEYLKARLREAGVFDVNAKSLFVEESDLISEKFLVCLLNSYFVFIYKKTFINNTSAFQINDARQLPVVIPTKEQLAKFEMLFDKASEIKFRQYEGNSATQDILADLDKLQDEVNEEVLLLYGLEHSASI